MKKPLNSASIGTINVGKPGMQWVGYVPIDGRELDREKHHALFELMGITYGAGNGKTTFNIPKDIPNPLMQAYIKVE